MVSLQAVASKRLGCLEDMQQIAGLEDLFGVRNLIHSFYNNFTLVEIIDSNLNRQLQTVR